MDKRDTTTVKLPISGETVIMKSWLTGRERRMINKVTLGDDDSLEVDVDQEKSSGQKIKFKDPSQLLNEMENIAIKTIVVSIGEITEENKVLEAVLDLREGDFDFIIDELEKVSKDADGKKKKNSKISDTN